MYNNMLEELFATMPKWIKFCIIAFICFGILCLGTYRETAVTQKPVVVVTDIIIAGSDTTQISGSGNMFFVEIKENNVFTYFKKISEIDSTPITISSKGVIFREISANETPRVEFEQIETKSKIMMLGCFQNYMTVIDNSRFSKITVFIPKGAIKRTFNLDLEK